MSDNRVGTNDVVVANEIGYLRRSSEENSRNIEKFYALLAAHMEKEEKERKTMDSKMTIIFLVLAILLIKDTELVGSISSVIKILSPLIL